MFDSAPSMASGTVALAGALRCRLRAGPLSSEVCNFGLQLIALEVEPVDDVALFAQFNSLICHFVSKLLDLQPPYCQPNRAVLNEWHEGDPQEAPK
jgi:hypothetical protein